MKEYKSAIPEIELRYKKGEVIRKNIKSSKDGYDVFMEFYNQDTFELCESVIVIFLNTANCTIGWIKHSSGGIGGSIFDIRLILATALKCAAVGIIVSHNHPSGNVCPSEEDIIVTDRLLEAGRIIGIKLVDHIIASSDNYYSFADEGRI